MEEVRYSETSVCFYQTIRCHIPEESIDRSHRYESLKMFSSADVLTRDTMRAKENCASERNMLFIAFNVLTNCIWTIFLPSQSGNHMHTDFISIQEEQYYGYLKDLVLRLQHPYFQDFYWNDFLTNKRKTFLVSAGVKFYCRVRFCNKCYRILEKLDSGYALARKLASLWASNILQVVLQREYFCSQIEDLMYSCHIVFTV